MKLRLFIALPLPEHVVSGLDRILSDFRRQSRDVKWVKAQSIHLTLKFLGDTDEALIPQITDCVKTAASGITPFETTLDKLGAFPNFRRPRVFWVGGNQPLEPAARIVGRIDECVSELGSERESRPFRPHLTLGRVRQGKRVDDVAAYAEGYRFVPLPCAFDRVVLFQSTLTPQGAIYKALSTVPLAAPEDTFGG